ncbi:efflux RND transporter permease subunit [Pseudoalteromonas peptidolytica]|uniref:efflux RND transporter permease subunit n=1 Tax=Pseudoalteromonas peptidolytica TaxID=61150 RepID=UPI00298E71E7|nr:MMPL family transporter [Pseudoalteromonas peptidolytica]MDW7548746.1 MMPL family transporter [Pseudoalteromonas peptidolytica]
MKNKLFAFIVGRPIWTTLMALLLVLSAAMGAQHLGFNDDYKIFFSEDNPNLVAYETVQAVFNKSDNVAFIVAPKSGDVFNEKHLSSIRSLTEDAWQLPYSSRVDSLTNYQHSWSEEDDLTVEDLVPDYAEFTPEMLARVKSIATNEPLIVNKLISPSGHVTVVNVTVQMKSGQGLEVEVVEKARELRDKYVKENPELNIMLTGMVMQNASFGEAAIHDNSVLVPLMFLVVLVLMLFLLKSITGTLSTIIIVVTSIVAAMGITGWIGIDLSGPSASAPIIILTLAVADCIHVLSSMIFEMRNGADKRTAIKESLKINLNPVILTSVTTAIGFLSMNFSDSPPFRDLGNIVAIGVMMACLLSLTLFPALLSILPVRVKQRAKTSNSAMLSLAEFVIRNKSKLLPAVSVLALVLVALLPSNKLNDNFIEYFDESMTIRQSTDFLQNNLSGIIQMEVAIDSNEKGNVSNPDFLQKVESFSEWLKQQKEVDHVSSISDTFKRLNKNMHADDETYYKLPENQELAAQYLLLYEMSLPYGLDLNNQINISKSSTRVIGTLKNLSSVELLDIEQRVSNWFENNAPEYKVMITGPDLMFAHIGQNNIKSMLTGTSIALVLISILIGIALRSKRYAAISLIPNMAPAAMGFGVWFLIDGQVGIGLSVVAGMTLGIVVDYTVHFLSKYLYAKRDKSLNTENAVRYAFENVGKALWVTTVVLVFGFIVMAQSTFKMNADLGFLTAVTISIALFIDFFLLPPLLLLFDKKRAKSTVSQHSNQIA